MRLRATRWLMIPPLLLMSAWAHAACIRTTAPTAVVQMNVGQVVVPLDSAVGAVLARRTFDIPGGSQVFVTCPARQNDVMQGRVLEGTQQGSSNVFSTNIPGIGIRLARVGASIGDVVYPHDLNVSGGTTSSRSYTLSESQFQVEVIKIAEATGTGNITTSQTNYTTYQLAQGGGAPVLVSRLSGNMISIVSPSCLITSDRDQVIRLPDATTGDFGQVGATYGETPFSINMRCNPGTSPNQAAYADLTIRFRGEMPDGYTGSQGVLKNGLASGASGRNDGSAEGIGVQLLRNDSNAQRQPVNVNDEKRVVQRLTVSDGIQNIEIPMLARYYQYANSFSGGTVSAQVEYTINYE